MTEHLRAASYALLYCNKTMLCYTVLYCTVLCYAIGHRALTRSLEHGHQSLSAALPQAVGKQGDVGLDEAKRKGGDTVIIGGGRVLQGRGRGVREGNR